MFSTGSYYILQQNHEVGKRIALRSFRCIIQKSMHAVFNKNYTVCNYTHITQNLCTYACLFIVHTTQRNSLYTWTLYLMVCQFAGGSSAGVTGSCGLVQLVLASCFLRAAIQHPVIPGLVSLLRHSSSGTMWMWMASLSGSSPGRLGLSVTVFSHLMEWWSFQTCSNTADFSRVPLWQASRCSLSFTQELYAEGNLRLQ